MADELSKYIGKHLKDIRVKRNLTQAEVAKDAGTEANYYHKLESGLALPSLKLLQRILKVLSARFRDVLP
jgi:transcriptional regulator with XRE-family HTH domain